YVGPDNFYPFISGPIYGILAFLPFFMFGDPFKATIGLGGTRINYLTSLIINYLLFIVSLMIVHNVLFQLSQLVTERTKSTTHIFHLASLFGLSNTITYLWVDMLVGIFLVGAGTVIAAVLYRFGYIWTLGITLGLGVLVFLWFTLGDMGGILKWILENMYLSLHLLGGLGVVYCFCYILDLGITLGLGVLVFFLVTLGDMGGILKWILENMYLSLHLLGGLGVVCVVLNYPLMKRVPLKP